MAKPYPGKKIHNHYIGINFTHMAKEEVHMTKSNHLAAMAVIILFTLTLLLPMQTQAAPKISRKKITLMAGKTATLRVKGTKGKVKWKSSKKKVVAVKKTGARKAKITAKKKGQAKVTAIVGRKKLVCQVTVKAKGTSGSSKNPGKDEKNPGKDSSSLKAPKLKKVDIMENSVRVYWSYVDGATGYEILRKDTGDWTAIATARKNALSYTDTTVKPGMVYTYTVRALDGSKKGRYDATGIKAAVPGKPDGETGETGLGGGSGTGETEPDTGTKVPESESEPETEGKIYMDRYERAIGSTRICGWGDYNSFIPGFVSTIFTAEQATAWISELNNDEKTLIKEHIQKSDYNDIYKEKLFDILNAKAFMTDDSKSELLSALNKDFSDHGFSNNHGNSSLSTDYYHGPWVEIPESEYEEWLKNNKK